MNDAPHLEHEFSNYGCTIRHTLYHDHAMMIDRDGNEQRFAVDRGMIAQGADSATLLAIHAAKADQKARREAERAARANPQPTAAEAAADSPADEPDTDVMLESEDN